MIAAGPTLFDGETGTAAGAAGERAAAPGGSERHTCPYDCRRVDYEVSFSSSPIEEKTLDRYVNDPVVLAALNRTKLDMRRAVHK